MKNTASFLLALAATAVLFSSTARAAGDPAAGEKIFPVCAAAAIRLARTRPGFGPQLNGIIGRPAGTSANYVYSEAMKNSGKTWDRDTLTAYLKDPKAWCRARE
jgi:cytochrome c